jgi:hypothetical protein
MSITKAIRPTPLQWQQPKPVATHTLNLSTVASLPHFSGASWWKMLCFPLLLLSQCKPVTIPNSKGQANYRFKEIAAYVDSSGTLQSAIDPDKPRLDIHTDSLMSDGIFVARWDEQGTIHGPSPNFFDPDTRLGCVDKKNDIYDASGKKIGSIELNTALSRAQKMGLAAHMLDYENRFAPQPR